MMCYRLPDGEPTSNLPSLIPNVINPQALTDAELADYDVARCTVVYPTVEWWQQRGARQIDTAQTPHAITWAVETLPNEALRARAAGLVAIGEDERMAAVRLAVLARERIAAADDRVIVVRVAGETVPMTPAAALAHARSAIEAAHLADVAAWEAEAVASDPTTSTDAVIDNAELGPWVQPTGAHDAHPLDRVVLHNGSVWRSLVAANVWEPGVSGWRNISEPTIGYPVWVQPTGAHDAYQVGERVTHAGQDWESTAASNIWEPGVYGWVGV